MQRLLQFDSYIFWSETNTASGVIRAALDGTGSQQIAGFKAGSMEIDRCPTALFPGRYDLSQVMDS